MAEHTISYMSSRRVKCSCEDVLELTEDEEKRLSKLQRHDLLLDRHDIHARSMKEQGR